MYPADSGSKLSGVCISIRTGRERKIAAMLIIIPKNAVVMAELKQQILAH